MDNKLVSEDGWEMWPVTNVVEVEARHVQEIAVGRFGKELTADEIHEVTQNMWDQGGLEELIADMIEGLLMERRTEEN